MTFDTPRTQTLRNLIAKEGPTGTGRIVGLSIEGADGVFLYTESAKWCDDSGSGTFRGDSETGAARAFLERVRKAEAVAEETAEAAELADATGAGAVTSDAATPRESAIAPSGTWATVYESAAARARPLGTVSRPYRGDSHGVFTLTDTEGQMLAAWARMPTLQAVRDALTKAATARAAGAQLTRAELAESAAQLSAYCRDVMGQARKFEPGTQGRATFLRSWALASLRAAAVAERLAEAERAEAQPVATLPQPGAVLANGARVIEAAQNGAGRAFVSALTMGLSAHPFATWAYNPADGGTFWGHYFDTADAAARDLAERLGRGQPRSLSAAATPAELRDGYGAEVKESSWAEAEAHAKACHAGRTNGAIEARERARKARTARVVASGAHPFRAVRVAMAERCARAVSDALGLGVDLFDPFDSDPDSVTMTGAPGWLDSDREFFGPEAGGFWAEESGAVGLGALAALATVAAALAMLAPVLAEVAEAMRAASALLSR